MPEGDLNEGLGVEVVVPVWQVDVKVSATALPPISHQLLKGKGKNVQIRKGIIGGGREREGMRSESRSIGSISADDMEPVAVLPGWVSSGLRVASEVAPAARSKLMQSM